MKGFPTAYTGMVKGKFRPSDDSQIFGFHIPSNAMAVVELRRLGEGLLSETKSPTFDAPLRNLSLTLASEIEGGIEKYGVVNGMYAYEVDGFGGSVLMDDANVPSLLSLPYLGYLSPNNTLYKKTRDFVWSLKNPFFAVGSSAYGIGSPHTSHYSIWPMSLLQHALTSQSDQEILSDLQVLKTTTANTFFMHESINVNYPDSFTRSWFTNSPFFLQKVSSYSCLPSLHFC